jgi:hypothetical protein
MSAIDKVSYMQSIITMSISELAIKLVSLGEKHAEVKDYSERKSYSEYYDITEAIGNFKFGRHEFGKAIDEACR